jgi:hypothetical protein
MQHATGFVHLVADAQGETAVQMRHEQHVLLRDRKLIHGHDDLL